MEKFCIIYHCKDKGNCDSYDSCYSTHTKTRKNKDFCCNEDETYHEQKDFPIGNEMSQISRSKIKNCTKYGCKKRQTDARSPDFNKYSSNDHHHKNRPKQWVKEELNQFIQPCKVIFHIPYNEIITPCNSSGNFYFRIIDTFAVADLDCLVRGEAKNSSSIHH